jgi:S1-C subfamily serine protease
VRKLVVALLILTAVTTSASGAKKPWLGMALTLRKGPDGNRFLYVAAVPAGTPAAKAGMAAGDVVTAINGRKISFRDDLDVMEFIGRSKPGDTIRLRVVRAGKAKDMRVRFGELPPEYEDAFRESLERARVLRERGAVRRS